MDDARISHDHECQECGYSPRRGDAIVSRGRFERLLRLANAYRDVDAGAGQPLAAVPWEEEEAAFAALQPGDLDPLPSASP
jgi:hypothetical protein